MIVASLLTLFLTAGTGILFGEPLTNPADVVARVDSPLLTVLAAATFLVATVGINLVANLIPPAYDLSNLAPRRIDARTGGLVAAGVAFFIGALWVSVIEAVAPLCTTLVAARPVIDISSPPPNQPIAGQAHRQKRSNEQDRLAEKEQYKVPEFEVPH